MTVSRAAAQALAGRLQSLWGELKSWRKVQELRYPGVHFATLNRIANSGGDWLPKDRKILKALGLVEPKPLTPVQKAVRKMARETSEAVLCTGDAVVRRKQLKEG